MLVLEVSPTSDCSIQSSDQSEIDRAKHPASRNLANRLKCSTATSAGKFREPVIRRRRNFKRLTKGSADSYCAAFHFQVWRS